MKVQSTPSCYWCLNVFPESDRGEPLIVEREAQTRVIVVCISLRNTNIRLAIVNILDALLKQKGGVPVIFSDRTYLCTFVPGVHNLESAFNQDLLEMLPVQER